MTPAQKAFDKFAATFDTEGNEWQDMGADQYFIAGWNAAMGQQGGTSGVGDFEKVMSVSGAVLNPFQGQGSPIKGMNNE